MTGFPFAIALDSLFELLVHVLAFLWRAFVGLLRLLFTVDFIIELLVEFWSWMRGGGKQRQESPPPED